MILQEEHVFKEHNPDVSVLCIPMAALLVKGLCSVQLYYHHGVVQKLKTLYDSILRPELLADQLTVEPSTRSDKSGISKSDKAGGGKGKEKASGKDKKGGKLKDEPIKEETVVPSQGAFIIHSYIQHHVITMLHCVEFRRGSCATSSRLGPFYH